MKTPTDAGLLPCPFCGAAAHFEIDEGRWEWVECESCGMQGNRSASLMEDCKPKLREEWNRRTPLAGASGEPEGWITWWPVGAGRYAPGYSHGPIKPNHGPELDEKLRKYPVYLAPPPQAVREPTPIRLAALELYTPPFRHEYGYIRDANNQMVADDAGSEASGLIASRIRGWGRIQYLDKPEQRAAALQDEVAEVVAEALNAYWAAHGITKGGQHGAE